MNWNTLVNDEQLDTLTTRSSEVPQVIFKHSTRCSISSMVKGRLDREKDPAGVEFHSLDLISYRALSNRIADQFGVQHESPQVLLIRNGKCIYHESHTAIRLDEILAQEMTS